MADAKLEFKQKFEMEDQSSPVRAVEHVLEVDPELFGAENELSDALEKPVPLNADEPNDAEFNALIKNDDDMQKHELDSEESSDLALETDSLHS